MKKILIQSITLFSFIYSQCDSNEDNNNPAMYYSTSLVDAMAQHQFKIYVIINNE